MSTPPARFAVLPRRRAWSVTDTERETIVCTHGTRAKARECARYRDGVIARHPLIRTTWCVLAAR